MSALTFAQLNALKSYIQAVAETVHARATSDEWGCEHRQTQAERQLDEAFEPLRIEE